MQRTVAQLECQQPGYPMGVTGGGVLTLHVGLLIDTRAVMPLGSEVVKEVSALLTEHVGPASDLAVAERNHGRSLTELA